MKFLAIIPARGGSKGIKHKNIVNLLGKPLIHYTIEAAQKSKYINRLVVSSEDKKIKDTCNIKSVEIIDRPEELATDTTPTLEVIKHAIQSKNLVDFKPDAIITLQATSPLRTNEHIDKAIEIFANDSEADSLVSCIEVPHIFNPSCLMRLNNNGYIETIKKNNIPNRRQDKETLFARNGAAIYITRASNINKYIFGGKILPYYMSDLESIDIDTEDDLRKAENIIKYRQI